MAQSIAGDQLVAKVDHNRRSSVLGINLRCNRANAGSAVPSIRAALIAPDLSHSPGDKAYPHSDNLSQFGAA